LPYKRCAKPDECLTSAKYIGVSLPVFCGKRVWMRANIKNHPLSSMLVSQPIIFNPHPEDFRKLLKDVWQWMDTKHFLYLI
jgi:hypothetical protein